VTTYTAATTNATNVITATPKDGGATVAIIVGGATVANGAAATWANGENIVKITVNNGDASKTYQITVTKT
jgi:S-adenosylmethionine hydrolase